MTDKSCRRELMTIMRIIEVDDPVMVRVYWDNCQNWEPGTVVEKISPVSFLVELLNCTWRRCHIDQLRVRLIKPDTSRHSNSYASNQPEHDSSVEPDSPVETDSDEDQDNQFEIVSQQQPPEQQEILWSIHHQPGVILSENGVVIKPGTRN